MTKHTRLWLIAALLAAAAIFLMAQGLGAQAPASDAQQAVSSLRAALARTTDQLGACHTELGPLQKLSAQVISGQLQQEIAEQARKDLKAAIEKANPGKTIDAAGKIIDVPAKEGR